MELREIIKELKKIRIEEELQVTDNVLFEQAIDIHLSNNIEEGKTRRTNIIENKNTSEKQSSEKKDPLTDSQKKRLLTWSKSDESREFLESKGLKSKEDIDNLTKKQAQQIIKEGYEIQEGK